jgi:hypothetical protein
MTLLENLNEFWTTPRKIPENHLRSDGHGMGTHVLMEYIALKGGINWKHVPMREAEAGHCFDGEDTFTPGRPQEPMSDDQGSAGAAAGRFQQCPDEGSARVPTLMG